ncbi:hypothetical protein NUW54_g14423 [Trametes sanguinea]|uniref:Uncharacterized protein n=1 Tax=Trametes sanguinea TaxID=158606 RepID=A0ACC1MCB2_9APHY|nr:hypothetical protein NUW54_g14423 [Trametes sanguinea]
MCWGNEASIDHFYVKVALVANAKAARERFAEWGIELSEDVGEEGVGEDGEDASKAEYSKLLDDLRLTELVQKTVSFCRAWEMMEVERQGSGDDGRVSGAAGRCCAHVCSRGPGAAQRPQPVLPTTTNAIPPAAIPSNAYRADMYLVTHTFACRVLLSALVAL